MDMVPAPDKFIPGKLSVVTSMNSPRSKLRGIIRLNFVSPIIWKDDFSLSIPAASNGEFQVKTTNSNHSQRIYPNLTENLVVTAPNQVWAADITYIGRG